MTDQEIMIAFGGWRVIPRGEAIKLLGNGYYTEDYEPATKHETDMHVLSSRHYTLWRNGYQFRLKSGYRYGHGDEIFCAGIRFRKECLTNALYSEKDGWKDATPIEYLAQALREFLPPSQLDDIRLIAHAVNTLPIFRGYYSLRIGARITNLPFAIATGRNPLLRYRYGQEPFRYECTPQFALANHPEINISCPYDRHMKEAHITRAWWNAYRKANKSHDVAEIAPLVLILMAKTKKKGQ